MGLPHIFPLDLAVLRLLPGTLEERLEGSLHQALPKEMSSFSESQKPQKRHYQQLSTGHLLSTTTEAGEAGNDEDVWSPRVSQLPCASVRLSFSLSGCLLKIFQPSVGLYSP